MSREIRKELLSIKIAVSKLGVKVLKNNLSGNDAEIMQPFVNIENAIELELEKLRPIYYGLSKK